jgi:aryl-alcohol dehydrogenase-like predicted oxidoreductase
MEYRRLGRSPLTVPAICLGTMTFGQQNTEAEAHAQMDYAFDRGINFLDAAEMYPVPARAETQGRTERFVGSWLKTKPRDKVIVATKVAGPSRGWDWIRNGPKVDRANILAAIDTSLQRLGTDYVDLYQIHWPGRAVPIFGAWQYNPPADEKVAPIQEQLDALADLVKAGKVRHIGLSNEQPWGLMQFLHLSQELELPRVVSVQNAYNLLNRMMEFGLTEVFHREDVALLAYSPLGFGHLSGKYLDDPKAPGRLTEFSNFGQRYSKPNTLAAVREYAALAKEAGLTPTQLALAFCYKRWFVTSTIIGATTMAQLKENLDAWDVTLGADLMAKIDAIHLRYPNPAP